MVSVIIPTLNAERCINELLCSIEEQDYYVDEIIVVDSQSRDDTVEICKRHKNVKVVSILRSEFDHGKTRDMAFRLSKGEYVLFLTQDALLYDKYYITNILKPFKDDMVAAVSGRQLAREDATSIETLIREFNYPDEDNIRSKKDVPLLGVKTFFLSDVCSAYRRDIYEKIGGFEYPLRTNEDMFYAAEAINHGYKIAYASKAKVIHSHNFSLKQQYNRNFNIGMELEKHKEILSGVSADSEGTKMVKYVSLKLLKKAKFISFVHFGLDCCARLLGNRAGKRYARKNK